MNHDEKMNKAWENIRKLSITDDLEIYQEDPDSFWLVDDIYEVRDAFYKDLESGQEYEEDLSEFFDRHKIKYQ
jgi:hypothetical protein